MLHPQQSRQSSICFSDISNERLEPRKRNRSRNSNNNNSSAVKLVSIGLLYHVSVLIIINISGPKVIQAWGLSSRTIQRRSTQRGSATTDELKPHENYKIQQQQQQHSDSINTQFHNYYNDDEEDEDDEDYNDDNDDSDIDINERSTTNRFYFSMKDNDSFTNSVSSFLKLQKSLGSDVLPTELQKQIDSGRNEFIEQYTQDATELEKLAMSSVTEQLPQPAVQQFTEAKRTTKKTKTTKSVVQQNTSMKVKDDLPKKYKDIGDTNFAVDRRVSSTEEIQLARFIQVGSALYQVKKDMESKLGREITKNEWAEYAGITSTRDLRRRISDYRKAKNELVEANIGLVHTVVKQQQYYNKFKNAGTSYDELVQEGSLGLIRAAELFDPTKGIRFSTYAVVWIKGTLQNSHVQELVKLPSRDKTKWHKIVQATKDIQKSQGILIDSGMSHNNNKPMYEEVAEATGIPVPEIIETQRRMNQANQVLSLDYEHTLHSRSGTESTTICTTDVPDENEIELNHRTQMHADLISVMARTLDPREARLLRLRYGLSEDGRTRTLQECADAMGISYTRVNQLATRCLEKLRQASDVQSLEEYLLTIV